MQHDKPVLQLTAPGRRWPLLGLTVLIHVLMAVLFMLRAGAPVEPSLPASRVTWIHIPASKPVPVPAPLAQADTVAVTAPVRRPAKKRERSRVGVAAFASAPPDTALPSPVEALADSAQPVFDREAALAAARTLANDPDPARAGTALAQFDARKMREQTEQEKLGRKIAGAKRNDCIGPNGGGSLLTPLMWLLDKKGSGCKL